MAVHGKKYLYYNIDSEAVQTNRSMMRMNYHKYILEALKRDPMARYANSGYDFSLDESSKILPYVDCYNYKALCHKLHQSVIFRGKSYSPKTLTYENVGHYKEVWGGGGKTKKNGRFYVKPVEGSEGKGIVLSEDPYDEIEDNEEMIAQIEIIPKLLNGKKWDVRLYVVQQVVGGKFNTFLFNDGIVRIAPIDFVPGNLESSLTNLGQQKKNACVLQNQMLFSELAGYSEYMEKIMAILGDVHYSLRKYVDAGETDYLSEFKMLGFDFLVSQNGKVYLLEINKAPSCVKNYNIESVKTRL